MGRARKSAFQTRFFLRNPSLPNVSGVDGFRHKNVSEDTFLWLYPSYKCGQVMTQEVPMDRRSFVIGSAASAAAFAAETAEAQASYPSRPIMFINPFPPG